MKQHVPMAGGKEGSTVSSASFPTSFPPDRHVVLCIDRCSGSEFKGCYFASFDCSSCTWSLVNVHHDVIWRFCSESTAESFAPLLMLHSASEVRTAWPVTTRQRRFFFFFSGTHTTDTYCYTMSVSHTPHTHHLRLTGRKKKKEEKIITGSKQRYLLKNTTCEFWG